MDPTDPIAWADMGAERPEPTCQALFERHRDELEATGSLEDAVQHLYQAYHEEYERDERVPDQGAAFVFAYLVEKAGIASLADSESDEAVRLPDRFDPVGLVERRPDPDELRSMFWEAEQVPWWIAVRLGVHYSLVQYWMWEDDIPVMRRNVPDDTLARIDVASDDEE